MAADPVAQQQRHNSTVTVHNSTGHGETAREGAAQTTTMHGDTTTTTTVCDNARGHSERARHDEDAQWRGDDGWCSATTMARCVMMMTTTTVHGDNDQWPAPSKPPASLPAPTASGPVPLLSVKSCRMDPGPSLPAFTMGVGYYLIPCSGENNPHILF